MQHTTIQQALKRAADNPDFDTSDLLAMPACDLIAYTLFDIANNAALVDRQSMARANQARTLIFQRMVGKRRAGTQPAQQVRQLVVFKDLEGTDNDGE